MLKKISLTVGIVVLCVFCTIAQSKAEKLSVVATLFPTYDFAKQVGKDKVDVTFLLPPGVEAHAFSPTPKDIVTIKKADVFIYTGEYMEPWAEDMLKGISNDKLTVVDSSQGVDLMDETDHGDHHGGDHAFEWAGAFKLSPGKYTWTFAKVDGDYADPKMKMVVLSSHLDGAAAIEEQEEKAEGLLESDNSIEKVHGESLSANKSKAFQLVFDPNRNITEYSIVIEKKGVYTFFTEHMPFEFEADDHFLKDAARVDVEPIAQEPETGHGHGHHAEGHGGGHAFEWAGAFKLSTGEYAWTFAKVDGDYADPKMKMVMLSNTANGVATIEDLEGKAGTLLESDAVIERIHGDTLSANDNKAYQVIFDSNKEITKFRVVIEKEGVYTFFTEHMPFEFEADEHFFKNADRDDVEPIAQEPDAGHGHHHHHHGGKDPHIWVDLDNTQKMVDSIAQAFVEKDPANKDFYLNNAAALKAKMADLDERFRKTLSTAKHKTIIYGGHFAFGYFAKRYGLNHESPYPGFSPNAEPSPKAIGELITKMRDSGQKYIYYEELIDPKVARIIAEETGATLELLHGAHNVSKKELKAGITFLEIMEDNLKKLRVGLEAQ
ncbi:MAG: zinc ABC transporter substrate-binding protein [Desulfobacterales bacterium]|nr:zinc ABC transporter substrate-binding protein [Desulfobacterales bacterium]